MLLAIRFSYRAEGGGGGREFTGIPAHLKEKVTVLLFVPIQNKK